MSYDAPKLIRYFVVGEDDILFECMLYIQHMYYPAKVGWIFEIFYPKLHFTWKLEKERPNTIYPTKAEVVMAGMVQVYTNQMENENIT